MAEVFKLPFWRSYATARNSVTNWRPKQEPMVMMMAQPARKRKRTAKRVTTRTTTIPVQRSYTTTFLNKRTAGFIGRELKWNDTTYSANVGRTVAAVMADNSSSNSLTEIAPGTGPTQRDGIKVLIKHLFIQGHIAFVPALDGDPGPPPSSVADSAVPYCKIWLVLDKQTNGAQMSSDDFLNDDHANTFGSLTFRNLENSSRFKVLAEKTIHPRTLPGHSGATSGMVVPFKMKATNINCYQRYIGTDGKIASIADCSLHLIAMKAFYDSGAADLTSDLTLTYVARTRFYAL